MTGIGLNPRYGWDPSPNHAQGNSFGFNYTWPPLAYDGLLPTPPPGYAWFDMGSASAAAPASPWGTLGATATPVWRQYRQFGPQNGNSPGVGAEPGYEYVFPAHHCKIHVLQSANAPWLGVGPFQKKCFNVPTNITIKELLQQFGCTNKDPARNKLIELTQGADGTWYKGIEVSGSDEKKMAKKIEEVGWNSDRNGVDGDFVWLYFVKE